MAGSPEAVGFGPDSRLLAVGLDGGLLVWDLEAQRPRAVWTGLRGPATAVALAPDGARLALGGPRSSVLLVDLDGGRIQAALGARASRARALASDGRRLVASFSRRGRSVGMGNLDVARWQPSPGRVRLAEGRSAVRGVQAWTRGDGAAGAEQDQTCRQWDGEGRKLAERSFRGGRRHGVWRSWRPNGRKQVEVEYRDGLPLGSRRAWDAEGDPLPAGGDDAGGDDPA